MTESPDPGGATVRGVLFDFHDTLAHVGSLAEWAAGSQHAAAPDDDAERVTAVLSDVWVRAGGRWPGSPWDLDAAEHRRAFTPLAVLEDVVELHLQHLRRGRPAPGERCAAPAVAST